MNGGNGDGAGSGPADSNVLAGMDASEGLSNILAGVPKIAAPFGLPDVGPGTFGAYEISDVHDAKDLEDKLGRAGDAARKIAADPLSLLPSPPWWTWVVLGGVVLGGGLLAWKVVSFGARLAPQLGPLLAPEAMPLWKALQQGQQSAAPAALPLARSGQSVVQVYPGSDPRIGVRVIG